MYSRISIIIGAFLFLAACEVDNITGPSPQPVPTETIDGEVYYTWENWREDRDGWKLRIDTFRVANATVRSNNTHAITDANGNFSLDRDPEGGDILQVEHQDFLYWGQPVLDVNSKIKVEVEPKVEEWFSFTPGQQLTYTSISGGASKPGQIITRSRSSTINLTVDQVIKTETGSRILFSENTHEVVTEINRFYNPHQITITEEDFSGTMEIQLDAKSRIVPRSIESTGTCKACPIFGMSDEPIRLNMPVFMDPTYTINSDPGGYYNVVIKKGLGITQASYRQGGSYRLVTD